MANEVLHVGDEVESKWGPAKVEAITICLRPSVDPMGEHHGANAESVEFYPFFIVGAPLVPFIADLDNGHSLTPWEVKLTDPSETGGESDGE